MPRTLTRRDFLRDAVAASAAGVALPLAARATAAADEYDILLLGDVHYDKLAHHDMTWLEREKAGDVRQVQNYSRLTAEVWPRTLERIRAAVAAPGGVGGPVAFVAHIGDFVEGLCGTPALAELQNREAIASVTDARLGAPFLFCKGNHDITGPGAPDAFDRVLLPFITAQAEGGRPKLTCFDVERANLAVSHGNDWFLFFDAYDPRALEWLERVLGKRTARHVFVLVHPPVVPYGARSTWTVLAGAARLPRRQRLLDLLGEHRAFVLTGHIHKYALATRVTERGPFVQLAISSVISKPDVAASLMLSGIDDYTPDQISVEPSFSPDTEAERRAVLAAEAPHVQAFEYGDVPGYARISIGSTVRVGVYAGLAEQEWRGLHLSRLRDTTRRAVALAAESP